MSCKPPRLPSYRRHATGQAFVQHNGKRYYLGVYGTPASEERYQRFIAELLVKGVAGGSPGYDHAPGSPLVLQVCAAFWQHAEGYFVKNGKPSGWLVHIKLVLRMMRQVYGHTPAVEFGPIAFKAIRARLVKERHSWRYINKLMAIVPRVFKWAAAEELVPASVYQGLQAVEGLKKGRTEAPERPPVLPVEDHVVEATLPYCPPIVADMVRFQRLTGCRPGEVCLIRPMDVDRAGDVWIYQPESHKTEHMGRERTIYLGPKAQEVLRPYLLRAAGSYCFSTAEAVAQHLRARHEARITPLCCGNRPGSNRRRRSQRKPGNCYSSDSYRRAVARAIEKANQDREDPLPRWYPAQLRHTAASEIRSLFELEASQVVLGHATADVTQVYAERDARLAVEVARRIR